MAIIELEYDGQTHSGDLFLDPLNSDEREDLRWYLEEYWCWPFAQFAVRGQQVENSLIRIGKRLHNSVFGSGGAQQVYQSWHLEADADRQITFASAVPQILSIPWELLHDEQGFLALRALHPVSIVRRLPRTQRPPRTEAFQPPLRILLATARPDDLGFIDPRNIARELLDELKPPLDAGAVAVEFLRPPTLQALGNRLSAGPPIHIFHFDGHGTFADAPADESGQSHVNRAQGVLAFETSEGRYDPVEADHLAQVLQGSAVRLAILNACKSAVAAEDDVFSSVAARLIQGGLDAVVAMSGSLLVASAAKYAEGFYRILASGAAVPLAHERGRQDMFRDPRRHTTGRRRGEEPQAIKLRDWWLPHLYQQRPLALYTTAGPDPSSGYQARTKRLSATMPDPPRYGWSGRARELHQIERWLLRHKLVVIHGFGGRGKTALAREAADWLTRTGMFHLACFVSFEHWGNASLLLREVARFLGVEDAAFNPQDTEGAQRWVEDALKTTKLIVIADNLEEILPPSDAALEPEGRHELWRVLVQLRDLGAGILVTTRDTNFGDRRLAAGPAVSYCELRGLQPDDAY